VKALTGGLVLTVALMAAFTAESATYNYGDHCATTVCYSNVWESSATDPIPLFGAPTISGNTLNFNPANFTAYAENGAIDHTDGQLGFDICASPGNYVDELVFSELGDYAMTSLGGSAEVDVSAFFTVVEILEVDGEDLLSPLTVSGEMEFYPNPDGTFSHSTFGSVDGLWSGEISIDIEGLLATNSIPFNYGATKIHIQMDNKLTALASADATAYIAKKDLQVFSVTSIPEPNSMVLIGIASSMIVFVRHKFLV